MLLSRLIRSLLSFYMPGIVEEGGGAAAPAPADAPAPDVDASAADTPVDNTLTPPADAEPGDRKAAIMSALDAVSAPEGTPAPSPAPTPAPAASPAPTAASKAEGKDLDLTPPEGMTPRAQERWAQLTERAKQVPDLERRASEAETKLDTVRTMVRESGLSEVEFTDMLEVGRLLKATDAAAQSKALERIDAIRADLALKLGKDVPGVDPLAAHPDLKADVDNLQITRERALEIARLRGTSKQHESVTREQQEYRAFEKQVQDAAASMDRTLAQRASTPGHEAKVAFIKQHLSVPENLQRFINTYQPQQWEAAVLLMYDSYTPPAAAPAPRDPGPQPLRGTNVRPGPAQQQGPATARSALDNAFAAAGLS